MKIGWKTLPFTDVFKDETGGNVKTLQSDFLPTGAYPIVDQGKELVAGYTNDSTRLCKSKSPVIIFGDHTKCLKFVDFPFCLGADGTKILRPKIEADPKYLFHFLRTIFIPDAGYSRHFKYLKKSAVFLPSFEEQKRIAAILDQADSLRRLRQRTIDRLHSLRQAIFYEMFPDGELTETTTLADFADIQVGYPFKSSEYTEFDESIRLCRGANVLPSHIDWSDTARWSLSKIGSLQEFHLQEGDTVIAMDRPWISSGFKVAQISAADLPALLVQRVARVRPRQAVHKSYIFFRINSRNFEKFCSPTETTIPHISPNEVRNFPIPIPANIKCEEFEKAIDRISVLMRAAMIGKKTVDRFFYSLQYRAFRSEV